MQGDCVWVRTATAWVDHNRNGRWDSSEPPLPEVRFFVDDVRNELVDVGQAAVSNAYGHAVLRVLLPDCVSSRFEIYAQPTPQYTSTTKTRMPGRGNGPFAFGFAPRNGAAGY